MIKAIFLRSAGPSAGASTELARQALNDNHFALGGDSIFAAKWKLWFVFDRFISSVAVNINQH